MGIEDDPDGIGVVVQILERQMRIVGDYGAYADEYGVVLPSQSFGPRLVLIRRYRDLGAFRACYLPVGGHGAVDEDERSHGLAPGVTVNL